VKSRRSGAAKPAEERHSANRADANAEEHDAKVAQRARRFKIRTPLRSTVQKCRSQRPVLREALARPATSPGQPGRLGCVPVTALGRSAGHDDPDGTGGGSVGSSDRGTRPLSGIPRRTHRRGRESVTECAKLVTYPGLIWSSSDKPGSQKACRPGR